ncbi:GTF2F1 [Bugula neritina]|uniref:Transcription initiation factor IIF subunit alpha n=1 Tax=Bugula neritina TaxID=10212 RepID=A0A7J7KQ29_BUGNE|nr:GTF2F1 [Bugula neritina]
MAAQAQQSGATKSFTVIAQRESKKRVSVLQFQNDQGFDKSGLVSLARENNLKEYRSAYNIDSMPTTGAGSEFGREAKEEARRRKFGYIRKKYNSEAQPWLMQLGAEKTSKKFKGTRNGGILENASYFIFTKNKDGMFEATPVEEWYNFKPTVSYNNLNAEEAEEEFARRDKNLNMFNIMVRKRIKKEDEPEEDDKGKVKKEVKSKSLMLTEMEDWADLSDEDGTAGVGGNDSDSSINGTKVKGKKGKSKKKKEKDTDDEAVEDSDDGDMEAKQVDYMSDTSNSDSDMEGRADKSKYEEKGVEDEDGLRDIVVESDDEKDKKENDKKEATKAESDASSSSSDSDSDDPDRKDDEFTKAFLMTGSKKERGKSPVPRSTTPTTDDRKRKLQASPRSSSPLTKKIKQEPSDGKSLSVPSADARPVTPVSSSTSSASKEGLTEDAVRRYLSRKPMSSKDLYKLFKSKKLGLSNEEIVKRITNIMKKLSTTQQKIGGIIHFSLSN